MGKYLLAHDLGTSGNKATLFSTDGKLIKSVVKGYSTNYFNNNWAEQNPLDWWDAVCKTSLQITADIDKKDIEAVSFSGQMMGCLLVDKNGNPLKDSIIWADQRATKEMNQIKEKIDDYKFYEITGHRISPSYTLQKLMWIKNNEPHIYENAYKVLNAKDFILYKLTGNFVTEYSDASGTNLMDLQKLKWSDELISLFDIDGDKLPSLHPSTYICGNVTKEAALLTGLEEGTKVICGGGDGTCATVGSGCIDEGRAYNVLGSSAWVSFTSSKPIFDKQMRTINFAHNIEGLYSPCGAMQSAGVSYSWLKNTICNESYEEMNEKVKLSKAGSNGLIFLPYLFGERSPRWNPDAKGAFIGLNVNTKIEDIIRSVLEGVTFNLNVILSVYKEHATLNEMVAIGGGAKGEVWLQILADIYNMPILVPNCLEEATSMGAAVTAGVGAGIFKDFKAVEKFINIEKTYTPITDTTIHYNKIKPIFDESYENLVSVFSKMSTI